MGGPYRSVSDCQGGISRHDEGMPVERLTPERRRQLTRDALIAAAADVFTRKGFQAASLEEIADTAGFTKGAIYSNFGSKEELLHAVIGHVKERGLAGIADTLDTEAHNGPEHGAVAAARPWEKLLGRSDDLLALSLELRLYAIRNPEARERVAELEREVSDHLAAFIEDAFARQQRTLSVAAIDLADLGRAAVDGLEQLAAIDPSRAGHYQRLVELLFVLLAKAASEP
ncbi:MAG TPA: TetR/AcrR family transcriptional regulator [Mycobacteriales bacterium]|nr:TetR/AcrR family transcriptional regulator [Mycobacteriales bacterium]